MLQDGFAHASEDRDARALAEQRVEAESLATSLRAAMARDGDLLGPQERGALEAGLAALDAARAGTDHRAIKAVIDTLNRASEPFAARRMDRAVAGALTGQRLDQVAK
jgi:molecular chaperone HscA